MSVIQVELDGNRDGRAGGEFYSYFATEDSLRTVDALPADGATGVPVDAWVDLLFTGYMHTGLVQDQFVLREYETGTEVEGSFYWPDDDWMVFSPVAYLRDNTVYEITFHEPPEDTRGVLLDGNGDGWAGGDFYSYFTTVSGILLVEIPATSKTSPAFIEGEYWLAGDYQIIGESPAGVANAEVLDERHFFVDIPLQPGNNAVSIRQHGTDPLVQVTGDVVWEVTDLAGLDWSSDEVLLRKDDSLLLTATGVGSLLEIDDKGGGFQTVPGGPGDTLQTVYDVAGEYIAEAKIDGVSVGTLAVAVIEVDISGPVACQVGFKREKPVWVWPWWRAQEVHFGAVDPDYLGDVSYDDASATVYLTPLKRGTPVLTARIGGEAGPIAAYRKIDEFTLDNSAAYSLVVMHEGEEGGPRRLRDSHNGSPCLRSGYRNVGMLSRTDVRRRRNNAQREHQRLRGAAGRQRDLHLLAPSRAGL